MPVNGDSIAALSPDELNAEHKVLAEFANLTNSQVYEHIFSQRMMLPKRNVASLHSASDILGTDSCELILPTLHEALQTELFHTADSPEFHLLDIGASAGEIIDWCLAKELEKNIQLNRQNIIHVVEPNSMLLKAYQQKICEFPHLNQGIVYNGRVQDYFVNHQIGDFETPLPLTPLDFINGLHVINYLVDINSPSIDPSNDIISFSKFLYSLLKPGGTIYFAHYNILGSLSFDDKEIFQKAQQIISSRNSLLFEGEIIDHLHSLELNEFEVDDDSDDATSFEIHKRKVKTIPTFNSYSLPSSFYARSLADMAVLLLAGQLTDVNEGRFDTKLLDDVLRQVKEAALTPVGMNEKKRFGLTRCLRGGEMVWKVDFPLIISIIRKEKVHV
ncbi:12396_t:CDS:2 [Funneliformis caledonium]|uniref:12396_t:CDS:1 n=1 Tax=Funneliformis caledonium TaxID=1117310 RepID=A0A9N9ET93_9GLOM|nr:12396_t:CDS:2 [Funneliformis caledonium]